VIEKEKGYKHPLESLEEGSRECRGWVSVPEDLVAERDLVCHRVSFAIGEEIVNSGWKAAEGGGGRRGYQ